MALVQFRSYLKGRGITDLLIIETKGTTHTAQEAADAHSVSVSNIVKSLLVVNSTGDPYLVLVPGDKRLDIKAISVYVNTDLRMANADEVKSITGYSIGGVPPFGHSTKLDTYVALGFDKENDLLAAAGAANTVFKLSYKRLLELTGGEVLNFL